MTVVPPPEGAGRDQAFEVVVHSDRRRVWIARARDLGHRGRIGLRRFRGYLQTPEGQRAALRTVSAVAVAGAAVAGLVVVRRWLAAAAAGFSGLAAGVRAAFGGFAAVGRTARRVLSFGWLGSLLRWLAVGGAGGRGLRGWGRGRACRCLECHARVRGDAAVCWQCGYRPGGSVVLGDVARHRRLLWRWVVFGTRVLLFAAFRRCPDCRRRVHPDARVCGACGYRVKPPV